MRRRTMSALATCAVTGLVTAGMAVLTAAPALAADPPTIESPAELEAGRYIVLMDQAPTATYDGSLRGFGATQPDTGDSLDVQDPAARKYADHLRGLQDDAASKVGADVDANLTTTLNGFVANLSAEQAQELDRMKSVTALVPDEKLHVDAVPSPEYLGLTGPYGVWNSVGGIDAAGEGVVVGVVDSGIAAGHPSFAGDELGTTDGAAPFLDGEDVVFHKNDGSDFRSTRVEADGWTLGDYNTKLIGARYFAEGALANKHDFVNEKMSPVDAGGHGSHTASTAAGNNGVDATLLGRDFGKISGVAPAAKVAAYKACWQGPDPADDEDDPCYLSDTMAAVDRATADGVDVINYSIGGGEAESTFQVEDVAFFNAAAAGVFVAASAGNEGPDPSTVGHAAPWYTVVGASTIPSYEGTVTLGDGTQIAGASLTVIAGEPVSAPLVYAGDIAAAGADAAHAALCLPDTLDPARAKGTIVVCDRGENARAEKSEVAAAAGAVGAIVVNVTTGSLDADAHSVPTVHVSDAVRDALLAYARTEGATATLTDGNLTGIDTPVPQIAGFSSRGPIRADGSDMLKPDVVAPGVDILAADMNKAGDPSAFRMMSGTSMASPHVAGLGALYLGEHPQTAPADIKSALMTTATNTVDEKGAAVTDPFAQGAGQVNAKRFLSPGLVYSNGADDWKAYLQGQGLRDFGVEGIDGSDLNLASIAIGSLAGEQKVTRTVTALRGGTYTASVEVPGINAVVSPSTITLAEGESATFTIAFSSAGAKPESWTSGFLTWSAGDDTVRSPIVVRPNLVDVPELVTGEGQEGTIAVPFTPSISDDIYTFSSGLAKAELLVDPAHEVPGHSGDQDSGADTKGEVSWTTTIEEGTTLARFDLDSSDDAATDLDLVVKRVVSPDDLRYSQRWISGTAAADESVQIHDPAPGTYLVTAAVYSFADPFTWDLTTAFVRPDQAGELSTPMWIAGTPGEETTYDLTWKGLDPGARYWGLVRYGDAEGPTSDKSTMVRIDTPAAPTVAFTGEAVSRCLGKNAVVAVKATNGADVAADFTIESPFGKATKKNVKPDASASVSLASKKADIAAGEVTVTASAVIDGQTVTTAQKVAYDAIACK